MIRVVAHTSSRDELARSVSGKFPDVCAAVSSLLEAVERRGERATKILVCELRAPETLSPQAPVVANVCGKIRHYKLGEVHAPGVRVCVQRAVNNFGVFYCVFTTACNFHTGSSRTSTLFRGGACREKIAEAVEHVFLREAVAEVLVNNIVYSAKLGHPVLANNAGIRRALEGLRAGRVELCAAMEDCMFVHSLLVKVDPAWLRARGVPDVPVLHVRVNVCRTGVANFFCGVPGGVPLDSAPEERLRPVCEALWAALVAAV